MNPNYNNYRKSQTLGVVSIPLSDNDNDGDEDTDTEIKTIPSESGDSDNESIGKPAVDGHIPSTNL